MGREIQLKVIHIVGIIAGSILLTGLIVGAVFSIEAAPVGGPSPLFGTTGYLPFFLSVVTVTLLSIGAWHAARTFRHGQLAEVASRFQKGAEMLGHASASTRIAGLYVLRDIALDRPEKYLANVLNTVTMHISQNDNEVKADLKFYGGTGTKPLPVRSERTTLRALSVIADLNPNMDARWPGRSHQHDGRFLIQDMFATHVQRMNENYSGIEFRHCFFGKFWMIECTLRDTVIFAEVSEELVLKNCDLRDAKLTFYVDNPANQVLPSKRHLRVLGGRHEGATVNGKPIALWVE